MVVQNDTLFSYIEHVGILNDQGELLAQRVQQGLVRAGMKDVTILSVQPDTGRRLIVRHGLSLHRVHVHPVQRSPRMPADEPGWLPLLVGSEFTDASAQGLADAGVSFLDERGNAHLSLEGRTVLFARAGKTQRTGLRVTPGPPAPATRAAGVLALNRASHRVAFALLANPELAGSPVRALAAAARVSVGTVHNTLAQLTEAGLLLDGQLHHAGRLLDAWAEAYRRLTIRPLTPRTLCAPDARWTETLLAQSESGVLLGGIAAAAALDNQVRATDGIVYATALGPAVTLLRLKADNTPFRVEVRGRFWGDGLLAPRPGLVPSVLTYGDLLRDGDSRSLEIATNLRRNDAHLRALG